MASFSGGRLLDALRDVFLPFRGLRTWLELSLEGAQLLVALIVAGVLIWKPGVLLPPSPAGLILWFGLLLGAILLGLQAAYRLRGKLARYENEERQERLELERRARVAVMDYERLRLFSTSPMSMADTEPARLFRQSLVAYREAISEAIHFRGARDHVESCARALAQMDAALFPNVAPPGLQSTMERIRALYDTPGEGEGS